MRFWWFLGEIKGLGGFCCVSPRTGEAAPKRIQGGPGLTTPPINFPKVRGWWKAVGSPQENQKVAQEKKGLEVSMCLDDRFQDV